MRFILSLRYSITLFKSLASSNAAHSSKLEILIAFKNATRELLESKLTVILPVVEKYRKYNTAPYAFFDESTKPCISNHKIFSDRTYLAPLISGISAK